MTPPQADVPLRAAIRSAMKDAGLSKQQLAARLAEQTGKPVDTTRRYLNRWTSKESNGSISRVWAAALAEALDSPVHHFLAPRAPGAADGGSEEAALRDSLQLLEATVEKLAKRVEAHERRLRRLEPKPARTAASSGRGARKR